MAGPSVTKEYVEDLGEQDADGHDDYARTASGATAFEPALTFD